ncbi:hypothetical protein Pcac1_g12600 [Phytophthora cactorum]|nr:hypothetical protein Pcac1_g12600 [Phytophthora cactorum]
MSPWRTGKSRPQQLTSESAAVAHEPVTGSCRPREDNPSASSSKRSRNDEEEKAPTPVNAFFSAFLSLQIVLRDSQRI